MARILALIILMTMMVIIHAGPPITHASSQEILTKGTSLTYAAIYWSPEGVEKEYYIVNVVDAFQGTQGMVYTLKITYIGKTTITKQQGVSETDISSYIPICSELNTEEIKAKGKYTFILPVPVHDLNPRIDPNEPIAYATIKLSLVTVTNYILNLTRISYKLKALYMVGSYKGYTVQAYLEEKTGLLLRMAFIDPKAKVLRYEVRLVYATNIGLLTKQENTGEGLQITSMLPLIIVLTIVATALITLLVSVKKISRILGP